jgi:ABC-type dipeptide/oligopeptide/nickel transport system ATPase subunit
MLIQKYRSWSGTVEKKGAKNAQIVTKYVQKVQMIFYDYLKYFLPFRFFVTL